jgi:hypothetical protein
VCLPSRAESEKGASTKMDGLLFTRPKVLADDLVSALGSALDW